MPAQYIDSPRGAGGGAFSRQAPNSRGTPPPPPPRRRRSSASSNAGRAAAAATTRSSASQSSSRRRSGSQHSDHRDTWQHEHMSQRSAARAHAESNRNYLQEEAYRQNAAREQDNGTHFGAKDDRDHMQRSLHMQRHLENQNNNNNNNNNNNMNREYVQPPPSPVRHRAHPNLHGHEPYHRPAPDPAHLSSHRSKQRPPGHPVPAPPRPPPTAGVRTGTVHRPTGESAEAPTWMRDANHDLVPRSKAPDGHKGWRTDNHAAFTADRIGKRSGAVLDDAAESNDGPAWMKAQTEYSPRPVKDPSAPEHGNGWKTTFGDELFSGAAGRPTGVVLDDSAQSSDAPDWMKKQTERAPRKEEKEDHGHVGWKTDFAAAFKEPDRMGRPSGAVHHDSAESGDAPRWMRKMGANQGVPRSKFHGGNIGWKTTFGEELFSGAAGRPTGVVLDDSAQSSDAPDWMKKQTERAPRKEEKGDHGHVGWKTDFTAAFKEPDRMGKPSGAVHSDEAESGDAPDWMKVQTQHSPRGFVPGAARQSNDLGVQGYRPVDFDKTHQGAAGVRAGILADDSAISADMPGWMKIPQVPQHPGPPHLRGERTSWKTGTDMNDGDHHKIEDTTVSAAAPAFFHVPGVPTHGKEWTEEARHPGGVIVGSSKRDFQDAAGEPSGGPQDDSCVSDEMPKWARTNKHVAVREVTYRAKGKGKVGSKTVPPRSDSTRFMHDDGSTSRRARERGRGGRGDLTGRVAERQMKDALTMEVEKHTGGGGGGALFEPSDQFRGPKHGCVFRNGPSGVGYYADGSGGGGSGVGGAGGVGRPPRPPGRPLSLQEREEREDRKMKQFYDANPEQEQRRQETQRIRERQQYTPEFQNFNHHAEADAAYAPSIASSRGPSPASNAPRGDSRGSGSSQHYRPVTGSKPQKFPLSRSSRSSKNRGSKKAPTKPPYPPSMKGGLPVNRYDGNNLPMDMQHPYHTFSTPKHLKLQQQMKMLPPDKYVPFMARGKNVKNYHDRPNTRMKGSISMAKNDFDNIPMHSYHEKLLSPRYRQYTKSREETRDAQLRAMSSRQLSSRGLSPRGPHSGVDERFRYNGNRMLNSAGSAQHPTIVSQDSPAWMSGSQGLTTNRRIRATGIRTNA